ncbi:MAG: helix-turn-helix domain-containing protein [Candidatus Levybacteria bacterium]|nr:helix-turn-helix domain-containing protein [Candidatus Levybacteria bacterium]
MVKASEKLRQIRLEKGLSLEEISQSTKIKAVYLECIEKGEYTKLPSVSHASGFVRNYAKFLGLNEKEVLALFRREFDADSIYRVLPKGFEGKEEFSLKRIRIKQTFFVVVFIFLLLSLYILFQYRYAFINPPLDINSPEQNSIIKSSQITISGKTDPDSTVYINKNVISVEKNGSFEKTISVFPGKFVIEVKAVNKFGKTSEIKRTVDIQPAY